MFSTLRKLSSTGGPLSGLSTVDQSVFGYLKTASFELSTVGSPRDLESLSRVVSSINSFQYPPFEPLIRDMFTKSCDSSLRLNLVEESRKCNSANALRYLKSVSLCNVPEQVVENLMRRVKIRSQEDILSFISIVGSMSRDKLTDTVFNATSHVVRNAINSNFDMSVYLSIFEVVDTHWKLNQRHLVPTKTRVDLVQAGWNSVGSLESEKSVVDLVRWMCLVGSPANSMCTSRLDVRLRTGSFSKDSLVSILCAMLRCSKLPEPLDSLSKLFVERLGTDLEETAQICRLVSALAAVPVGSPLSDLLIPSVVAGVSKNLPLVPSRELPNCLSLLNRVDPSLVCRELALRGFEMDPLAIAHLIAKLDHHLPFDLLNKLFATPDFDQAKSFVDRFESVELKAEFLAALRPVASEVSILVDALVESIRLDVRRQFSVRSLVRMAALGGDALFASTGIVPSELVGKAQLSIDDTLMLLNGESAELLAPSLFENVFAATSDLSVDQTVGLLALIDSASNTLLYNRCLKRIIPKIDSMDARELLQILSAIHPVEARGAYAPATQLRCALIERFAAVLPTLTAEQSLEGFLQFGRLGFGPVPTSLVNVWRASPSITRSSEECVLFVKSCFSVGFFDGRILKKICNEFTQNAYTCVQIAEFAENLIRVGVSRNEEIVALLESTLRQDHPASLKISILKSLAKWGDFSPLFQEEFRKIWSMDLSNLANSDWVSLFDINLVLVIESPPRIKVKYVNNPEYKAFIDDHSAFAWYVEQEKARSAFIHSPLRGELMEATRALGWTANVPENGKEIYHIDLVSRGDKPTAFIVVPKLDVLEGRDNMKIIVGDSMAKLKHLGIFGYRVVVICQHEWALLNTLEQRKEYLLNSSQQTVYSLGHTPTYTTH